jgi:hypothetical protein
LFALFFLFFSSFLLFFDLRPLGPVLIPRGTQVLWSRGVELRIREKKELLCLMKREKEKKEKRGKKKKKKKKKKGKREKKEGSVISLITGSQFGFL